MSSRSSALVRGTSTCRSANSRHHRLSPSPSTPLSLSSTGAPASRLTRVRPPRVLVDGRPSTLSSSVDHLSGGGTLALHGFGSPVAYLHGMSVTWPNGPSTLIEVDKLGESIAFNTPSRLAGTFCCRRREYVLLRGDAQAGTDAVRTSWEDHRIARGRRRRCGRGYSAEDRRGVVGPAVTARTVVDDVVERARACHNGDARRNWCRTASATRMVEPIARSGPWAGRPTGLAAAVAREARPVARSPPDSERFS